VPLVNRCRIGRLEASTEEKKKYGPPNFGPGCLKVTYQTGTRFTVRQKRKEGASTRTTFLSGEDTSIESRKEKRKKVSGGEKSVSGYRRRVEFGYIWASHFSFPACCQKVLPLSIHNQARGATRHAQRSQTLPLPVSASVTTQLYTIRCVFHHSISANLQPSAPAAVESRRG
jgi:hypothetical protein